jgi:hypothetical protein
MAYKIQAFVESGFDFAGLFPEKQEAIRTATGMDFNLDSIVKFLQKQTNNFTIDNNIAHDLDSAIYKIILKSQQQGGEPMPAPAPEVEIDFDTEGISEEDIALILKLKQQLQKGQEFLELLDTEEEKNEFLDTIREKLETEEMVSDGDKYYEQRVKILKDFLNKN